MIEAAVLHSFCDLCGHEFRQYVVDVPKRHICPPCLVIEDEQAARDDYLKGMRG